MVSETNINVRVKSNTKRELYKIAKRNHMTVSGFLRMQIDNLITPTFTHVYKAVSKDAVKQGLQRP